ncbi:MAG: hypothetical protein G8D28_09470 [gamma proteobacterium symbiont of Phacoides pectinatus]
MDQERAILSILYDMALTIGGETRVDALLSKVLQRFLYHTGFPVGLALTVIPDAGRRRRGYIHTVSATIGSKNSRRAGWNCPGGW